MNIDSFQYWTAFRYELWITLANRITQIYIEHKIKANESEVHKKGSKHSHWQIYAGLFFWGVFEVSKLP